MVYLREGKRKGFKFLLSNGQHPTNQIQGGRNRRGQNNHDIKPYSSLKPRFGLQGEEELAGPPRSCPLRRAGPRALLRVRTVTPALCLSTKFSRHPRSCGSHSGRGFCGDGRVCGFYPAFA
ncbi:hypothetical protein VPH35_092833 [Triticum aestivum]